MGVPEEEEKKEAERTFVETHFYWINTPRMVKSLLLISRDLKNLVSTFLLFFLITLTEEPILENYFYSTRGREFYIAFIKSLFFLTTEIPKLHLK